VFVINITDLCSEVGGYCPVLRGTPVVVVRVGAYLLLLFVFVAGITEIPREDKRTGEREQMREEGSGEVKMCDCINGVYEFIVSNRLLSHNHCHQYIYRITISTC
jgi:hypothetical protein